MKKSKSKKVHEEKIEATEELPPLPLPSFNLSLGITELVHLRDMLSILMPPEMSTTLSQALAIVEQRQLHESKLWNKIAKLCVEANVPMEDAAPDYVVTVSGPPPMGVFRLNADMPARETDGAGDLEDDEDAVFGDC